jgi:hypothetical protein
MTRMISRDNHFRYHSAYYIVYRLFLPKTYNKLFSIKGCCFCFAVVVFNVIFRIWSWVSELGLPGRCVFSRQHYFRLASFIQWSFKYSSNKSFVKKFPFTISLSLLLYFILEKIDQSTQTTVCIKYYKANITPRF